MVALIFSKVLDKKRGNTFIKGLSVLITLDDVDLFYRVEGIGEPALVMHGGLGADHTCFVNSGFNRLSESLELIYYDHRCNGRSSCPGIESLTHGNLAGDADKLRAALGHESVTVIGHSYGGMTGLEYALRYPSHLRRLILITTSPIFAREETREIAQRRAPQLMETVDKILNADCDSDEGFLQLLTDAAPLYFREFPPFEDDFTEAAKDIIPNAEAFRHSFLKLLSHFDLRDKLASIEVPVLILSGRHDWITPPGQSEFMHEQIPRSELIIFEKSAHWAYIEEEDLFLETVNNWLCRT